MKKYVAWVGAIAVVAVLGFSGYAVADAPDLYARSLTVAGPLVVDGSQGSYNGPLGGPFGVGTIPEGKKCIQFGLETDRVDGYALSPDYNQSAAFVTLQGMYPGISVAGTYLHQRPQDSFISGLHICLTRNAPPGGVRFGYLIANISWTG